MIYKSNIGLLLLSLFIFISCNKDETIGRNILQKPVISLDSETGFYVIKVGKELTIAPTVEHTEDAIYSWIVNGKLVGMESTYTATWTEKGVFYVIFRVETPGGTAEEELRVDVAELAPPVISLVLPSRGLKVLSGTDYLFTPDIQNQNEHNFRCEWIRDGKVVYTGVSYTFNESRLGSYPITIKASNIDGETIKEIVVEVVETLPYEVKFEKPSYFQTSTDRYTFAGRPVYLSPLLEYFDRPDYTWSVDGVVKEGENNQTFVFTPSKVGEYTIKVSVAENPNATKSLTRNITRATTTLSAEVIVHCSARKQEDNFRPASANSLRTQHKVYEYTPAPGQFIGELNTAGFTGNERTQADAIAYATRRLSVKNYVSLGGFGGYIIVGFDHSVPKTSNQYDFTIQGNAFDGSSEPGIVWVMQDINANGLPDDEWYELKGSETGKEGTIQNHAVTYYRPAGKGMDVRWTDSKGNSGKIDYLLAYHAQDFYYPQWVKEDAYTLRGTFLQSKNIQDPSSGIWKNQAYDWGYVDNFGKDQLTGGNTQDGSGQKNGFKLSNAIFRDRTAVDLQYIDFVKVQVGVNAKSGPIGEVSTEVFSFIDLSITN